jgi:hypothetical protein
LHRHARPCQPEEEIRLTAFINLTRQLDRRREGASLKELRLLSHKSATENGLARRRASSEACGTPLVN